MLENKIVSSYLQEQLTLLGNAFAPPFEFLISADIGNTKEETRALQGILKVRGDSEVSPVAGVVDITYHYRLDMFIPKDGKALNVPQYNKLIDRLIDKLNGKPISLSGGQAVFVFSIPSTHDLEAYSGIGKDLLNTLHIDINYTVNAVTASDQKWQLNGNLLNVASFAVQVNTEAAVNSVHGQKATQALPVRRQRLYSFTLQYAADSASCKELQQDLLAGNMSKSYQLEYFDGVAFTKSESYKATVSLYQNNSSGAALPSVGVFELVFTDVDPKEQLGFRCELALINTAFDNSTQNTRYFASDAAQLSWFNARVLEASSITPWVKIKAPNLNSLTITQQVYFNPHSPNQQHAMLNRNYAVIRTFEPLGATRDYYYFITNATVGADNQIMYDLELDTLQTYMQAYRANTASSITRAHLDRWQ